MAMSTPERALAVPATVIPATNVGRSRANSLLASHLLDRCHRHTGYRHETQRSLS
ncbi:hypothetical protein ACIBL3_44570 [Kribbella sp. NPDC050124]|uniref:hypothetical protein n=1 Tax=Kribbella sp. NPDC050124 TaxID=3364114 RepID=UPI00379E77D3